MPSSPMENNTETDTLECPKEIYDEMSVLAQELGLSTEEAIILSVKILVENAKLNNGNIHVPYGSEVEEMIFNLIKEAQAKTGRLQS